MSFRANNLIWFESQQEEVVHVPKVMQHERQHHFHVEECFSCFVVHFSPVF